MLGRHRRRGTSIGPTLSQCVVLLGYYYRIHPSTRHSPIVGLMVDQRRRRWNNIDPTMGVLSLRG